MIALLLAAPASAQLQPELHAELVRAAGTRAEVGIGASARAGTYLRSGLSLSRDVWWRTDTAKAAIRGEFVLRFMLDPVAEQRWGVSFGGGLGYRERAYLLAVAELEGPRRGGARPAFQLLLGGGVRFGFVFRRAAKGRR